MIRAVVDQLLEGLARQPLTEWVALGLTGILLMGLVRLALHLDRRAVRRVRAAETDPASDLLSAPARDQLVVDIARQRGVSLSAPAAKGHHPGFTSHHVPERTILVAKGGGR